MDTGTLRAKWARDEAVVGPVVQLAAPAVVEIMAVAGFDFVMSDLEHGRYGIGTAEEMVRAADARSISAVVRVQANRPELIAAALECGAACVLVPHVESVQEARDAVSAMRFHPQGTRGLSPTARSADYSAAAGGASLTRANESVIAGVLVEGEEGYAELDGMLELDGLDLIMVAPYDLSQSLGRPGEVTHPEVIATVQDICARVIDAGKIVGMFTADPRAGAGWIAQGVRFLILDIDIQLLYRAASSARAELAAAQGSLPR
jgi:4-hydroxy-2-oxoheptanedioate aldolase